MLMISTCPTCGSRGIKRVRKTVTGVYKDHPYRAPRVLFHECPDCGEKVYDRTAMQRIDAARKQAVGKGAIRKAKILPSRTRSSA